MLRTRKLIACFMILVVIGIGVSACLYPYNYWLLKEIVLGNVTESQTGNYEMSTKVAEIMGVKVGMKSEDVKRILGSPARVYSDVPFNPNPPLPDASFVWDYEYLFFWGDLSIFFDINSRIVGLQSGYL